MVITNFHGLNVSEDNIEYESFAVILLILYSFMKTIIFAFIYLDNCAYKLVGKQVIYILVTLFLNLIKTSF